MGGLGITPLFKLPLKRKAFLETFGIAQKEEKVGVGLCCLRTGWGEGNRSKRIAPQPEKRVGRHESRESCRRKLPVKQKKKGLGVRVRRDGRGSSFSTTAVVHTALGDEWQGDRPLYSCANREQTLFVKKNQDLAPVQVIIKNGIDALRGDWLILLIAS